MAAMETTDFLDADDRSLGVPEFGRRPGMSFSMPFDSMFVVAGGRTGRVSLPALGRLFDRRQSAGARTMGVRTRVRLFAWLPDRVRDRLTARAKLHGSRPFIIGQSTRLETVTNVWRRRLAQAFEAAGPFEQEPTPHRFRHTFARRLLQDGNSIDDVAMALGDDPKTVALHYSAWVPERQERLTRMFKKTYREKPKKLVGISGGRK